MRTVLNTSTNGRPTVTPHIHNYTAGVSERALLHPSYVRTRSLYIVIYIYLFVYSCLLGGQARVCAQANDNRIVLIN